MIDNKKIIFNKKTVYFSVYILVCSLLLLVLDLVILFYIIGVPLNLYCLFFLNKKIVLEKEKIEFRYYLRPVFRKEKYEYAHIEALDIHLKQDSKNAITIKIKFKESFLKKEIIFSDMDAVYKFLESIAEHSIQPKVNFSRATSAIERENILEKLNCIQNNKDQ